MSTIYDEDGLTIHHGNAAEVLKTFDDDSVDLVCTDPPYGLAFMDKNWDRALPSIEVWRECLRVLKSGAFAFVLCTPRQDCLARMICRLEDAGFSVGFTSIYWAYASGFPKAQNLSKAADRRAGAEREVVGEKVYADGHVQRSAEREIFQNADPIPRDFTLPATPEAKSLDGAYGGFQPKPAVEVVLTVMKPPAHGTWIDQALDNGKGCTWLDRGRIPTGGETIPCFDAENTDRFLDKKEKGGYPKIRRTGEHTTQGRFPANLIIQDGCVDDGRERVSTGGGNQANRSGAIWGGGAFSPESTGLGDSGSFSRYFSLDAWWEGRIKDLPIDMQKTFPFLLCPKASSAEKNQGLTDLREQMDPVRRPGFENPYNRGGVRRRNNHPTVKPIPLMSWLITIGSRKGDLVLDPFLGSGTTAIAAKLMERDCVGVELDRGYCEIAVARLTGTAAQRTLF